MELKSSDSGIDMFSQCWHGFTCPDFINPFNFSTFKPFIRKRTAFAQAFTMAEILISLTIIGIIAAITLPALQANINEKTWVTQKKALYSRMSQAIALMGSVNGYGIFNISDDYTETAAKTFITDGLAKVLKINNICDNQNVKDCGIVSKFQTLGGITITTPLTNYNLNPVLAGSFSNVRDNYSYSDVKAAAFETQNGESILLFYNPLCRGNVHVIGAGSGAYYLAPYVCANLVYDLNGKKGPNKVGKDIGFITVLNPSDPTVVAPFPASDSLGSTTTYALRPNDDSISAAKACSNYKNGYRIPNLDELMSMGINYKLIDTQNSTLFGKSHWQSDIINGNIGLAVSHGNMDTYGLSKKFRVWCVKR